MSDLTVVMYHYVRRIHDSRYPGIKGLEFDLFLEQVAYIKKNYTPITIEQAIHSFESGEKLPNHAILLTFDDAYSDHFINVYPVLKKNNIQGCFYAPAKAITENIILDVNKLHFILSSCKDLSKIINHIKILLEKERKNHNIKNFDEYYSELAIANRFDSANTIFIKRLLQVALPEPIRNRICDHLFKYYVEIDEKSFSKELYMNKFQLEHMINDGMHVGAHGYDHYWWNKLTDSELNQEIELSLHFLNTIGADNQNWTACYPYGSSSDNVVNKLGKMGCKIAFTTQVDIANINSNHRLLIPRLDTNDLPKHRDAKNNKWFK
ncbi:MULTISPECIES: polysaccharide deacetylase family protein [Photorhabdus]|nr:polysaccharide deacetylase family protein [Photorhabdus thracensis]